MPKNRDPIFPPNEQERLRKLRSLEILDTSPETIFDELTELAAYVCHSEVSLISLIDKERQWFKSSYNWDAEFTKRSISFCRYTILADDIFEVEDAAEHELTSASPLVTGKPGIRFYAGAPLLSSDGFALGTICVIDFKPKKLSKKQRKALRTLSHQVAALIETRRIGKEFGIDYSAQSREGYQRSSYHKLAAEELTRLLKDADAADPQIRKAQQLVRDLDSYNGIAREGLSKQMQAFDLRALLRKIVEDQNTLSPGKAGVILFLDEAIPTTLKGDPSHLQRLSELLFDTVAYSGKSPVKFAAEVQWESEIAVKVLFSIHEPLDQEHRENIETRQRLKHELINQILLQYHDSLQISFEAGFKLQSFEMEFSLR